MDDILVYVETQALHEPSLKAVLEWLVQAGMILKRDKSEFSKTSINFLGQISDSSGVTAGLQKGRAVSYLEEPTDVSE